MGSDPSDVHSFLIAQPGSVVQEWCGGDVDSGDYIDAYRIFRLMP